MEREQNPAPRKSPRRPPAVLPPAPPPMIPAAWTSIPCEACIHWKPMAGSDFGGYCALERWTACKPLNPGVKPYAHRMEVAA